MFPCMCICDHHVLYTHELLLLLLLYYYSAVPGMYEGRPARYFDNRADMRNHRAVEDASATRNYFATDLLDLNLDADTSSGTYSTYYSIRETACVLCAAGVCASRTRTLQQQ
jgi:hypothetical protein